MHHHPGAPRPADGVQQPSVPRPPLVGDPEVARYPLLVGRPGGRVGSRLVRVLDGERQHALLLAPEHGEDAVRGQPGERLVVLEPVGELGARLLLPRHDARDQPAPRPEPLAQLADHVGVLGEALDQDRPGTVERRGHVGHPPVGIDVPGRLGLRVQRRVPEQRERQRLQPRLARPAPSCGAWACTAGRRPRGGPWSRPPRSAPRARGRACPAAAPTRAPRHAAARAPAGRSAARRGRAGRRRRGRR